MGRQLIDGVEKAWIDSVVKYPSRFGRLAGLFYNLLDESNITEVRKIYYKDCLRTIDNPPGMGDNHASGDTTNK